MDVAGALITIMIGIFLFTAFREASLGKVLLPESRHQYRALREKEKTSRLLAKKPKSSKKLGTNSTTSSGVGLGNGIRAAFYVSWDAGSLASLREYHSQIDLLFPEWLHVLSSDGRVQAATAENKMFDVVEAGTVRPPDEKVMPLLKDAKSPMQVFPLVNNFDPVSSKWLNNVGDFLTNVDGRNRFRNEIDLLLASDKYGGLTLDFEEIPRSAQPGFDSLVSELYADLHSRGLKLYVNVPVDDNDFDYKFLAVNVDALIFMDYDEHQVTSGPGSIAGQDWFIHNLQLALKDVPKEKVMVAIGNYGYDWESTIEKRGRGKLLSAHSMSVQEAWLRAVEADESIATDPATLNPHFAYEDSDTNTRHDLWLLDAPTALNHMRAANDFGLDSFALWRLGSEDRAIWQVWDAPSEQHAAQKLRDVPPGQDVDREGEGEILYIQKRPRPGVRDIQVDPNTGNVNSETFKSMPVPYTVAQYGFDKKRLAISFDDGPDPKFTPKILDILRDHNAKATFFLIGSQAERNTLLTQRIYREGHEIGNHTWTHPDISSIGRRYVEIELNLTERFLESKIGVKPVYFRPPYSVDQEPDTADQVRPLEDVQDRGYITVGNKIDPYDWRDNPQRTAEQITQDVLTQVEAQRSPGYVRERGSVILLHDGGGDRRETVRALPMIIEQLRSHGYEIVPISALLGKTRDDVMPPISSNERFAATVDSLAFSLYGLIYMFIVGVFFLGDILMTSRLLFVGFTAIFDRLLTPKQSALQDTSFQPPVAVMIPAYNEEKVIVRTVRSVIDSDYPHIRVIVIDDGSKDQTYNVVRTVFAQEIAAGQLTLLTKPNSGKAAAANYGLEHVTEEVFVAIDADTIIASSAISYLVPHFKDQSIAAIAGNAKVGNRINLWTRWQALEYITSQNFERRALDAFGVVTVVPGAIGAWRTAAVREAGNYPYDTVAEDADLTMSLLQRGHKVHYEDRALAYTEAPVNAGGLMRQRFRWSFGILQATWKHRAAFWRGGALGWFALPNILIFQILLPLVSPFIDLMFLFGAISYYVDRHFHPDTASTASFHKLVLFFVLFLVIDFVTSVIAFALERKEARSPNDKWLLSQVWLQRFAYRQLFSLILFKTLKRAVDGRPFAWDKLERTGGDLKQVRA